jgi:hypothetical protein
VDFVPFVDDFFRQNGVLQMAFSGPKRSQPITIT